MRIETNGRCHWAGDDPDYCAYHDDEWGVPVHDDTKLFEMLVLEGFQAGLSWLTILKRRASFARAFANWDWNAVAAFTPADAGRLLNNKEIIRNRLKIESAINNAKRFMEVRAGFGSFDGYIWRFTGNTTLVAKRRAKTFKELPTHTPESDAMSADLNKREFTFVGPVICYAYMQTIGMVDDHLAGCFKARRPGGRSAVSAELRASASPTKTSAFSPRR